jgi:hypothetical protein
MNIELSRKVYQLQVLLKRINRWKIISSYTLEKNNLILFINIQTFCYVKMAAIFFTNIKY